MQFTELNLNPDLLRGIQDLGFETCTDVQAETFQNTLQGRDVTVQSQTGSGKTAAFLITIFQLMNETDEYRGTRALIVAPTRELAVQIENDAKALGKYLPQKTGCFYGGVGYGKQEQDLSDKVELVIGTPGRLLDFNQSGKLDFRDMGILVIDEADRLFDMGFYPDIRKMMRRARPRTERLTMLYSATLSVSVRNISWQFMNDPVEIEIRPESMTVETVEQELYHVARDEKFPLLLGLLKREQPRNALIFCNTKRATEIVAKKLQLNGYECEFIIGDLPQKKRLSIIDRIKGGTINMLTATDVAARGLHVDDLDLVVNYDLPEDPEAYVHRIGRTARAGRSGKAVSLACERFVYSLESIEELIDMKIPTARVSDDLLLEDASAGKSLPHSSYADRQSRGKSGGRPGARSGGRGDRSRSTRRPAHAAESAGEHPRSGPGRDGGDERPSAAHHPRAPRHAAAEARSTRADHETAPRRRKSRGDGRPRSDDRGPASSSRSPGGEKGPSRDSSMDERIAYYREKYGEDFDAGAAGRASGSGGSRGSSGGSRASGSGGTQEGTRGKRGGSGGGRASGSGGRQDGSGGPRGDRASGSGGSQEGTRGKQGGRSSGSGGRRGAEGGAAPSKGADGSSSPDKRPEASAEQAKPRESKEKQGLIDRIAGLFKRRR